MADFCTITDVADLLQIEIDDEDSCAAAIAAATAAIRNYTRQYLELVEDDEVTFDVWTSRRRFVIMPEQPVVSVASVVEDGTTLVEGTDFRLVANGMLYREGLYWSQGAQILVVTYTHGYATIPDDVIEVCSRAASRRYQAGLSAEEAAGVLGLTSKSLGDYSVGFGAPGTSEGMMGASGSRMLLLSEKDMLDKYRMNGPG